LRRIFTEHVGQLTGTRLNPMTPYGFGGTDLGVAFERDGKLVFLFGDSWPVGMPRQDEDSVAWADPDAGMPLLHWVLRTDGQFAAPRLTSIDLQGMNVPVEGVTAGALTYVFFSTGWSDVTGRHTQSVLAHMTGLDVPGLVVDHAVATDRFINLSVVQDGTTCWIYGNGPYRRSAIYLARVDCAQLATRAQWRYLTDAGTWSAQEAQAAKLVDVACAGEMSVRRIGPYLMTYNCDAPRGVHLRWSHTPEGPFSDPVLIYEPQDGYERFIHAKESFVGHDDGLSEPGREETWGGEYGPYLIPALSRVDAGTLDLAWVLSSWNPYQVHLMRSIVAPSGTAPVKGAGLPKATLVNGTFSSGVTGWQSSGAAFAVFTGGDGQPRLTTFAPNDAATGMLWQDFTVDSTTSALRFLIHGGDARVELLRGNEVVRSSHGRRMNSPETEVIWRLEELRGDTLRVRIVDDLTAAWGFVGAGLFELR
jgi:hypothetical protein